MKRSLARWSSIGSPTHGVAGLRTRRGSWSASRQVVDPGDNCRRIPDRPRHKRLSLGKFRVVVGIDTIALQPCQQFAYEARTGMANRLNGMDCTFMRSPPLTRTRRCPKTLFLHVRVGYKVGGVVRPANCGSVCSFIGCSDRTPYRKGMELPWVEHSPTSHPRGRGLGNRPTSHSTDRRCAEGAFHARRAETGNWPRSSPDGSCPPRRSRQRCQ